MPDAIFGISSSGLSIVTNLLVLFLVLVYVALVYWTYLDAKRRMEDPVLVACATAAALFPFVGTIVYTILRPPEFLEDVRERELEIRASELRVRELIEQSCPHCEYPVERSFLRCPNCERRLKSPCRSCGKPLDPKWGVCPYCETEVRKQKQAPEGGGRRAPRERRRPAQRPAARPAASGAQRKGSARPAAERSGSQRPAAPRQGASSGGRSGARQSTRSTVQRTEGRPQDRQWREP